MAIQCGANGSTTEEVFAAINEAELKGLEAADSAAAALISEGNASSSANAAQEAESNVIAQGDKAETEADRAQVGAWKAEAEKLTADSYATQPEDLFVDSFTSNGDGTFTATPTIDYSSLHWSNKTASSSQLDGLTDVTTTNPQAGESLVVNPSPTGANDIWINGKVLGLPNETGNTGKSVTTDGVEGDSRWSPVTTNPNLMDVDYAISVGTSASVVSGFTIANGVTLTIPDGSVLGVV